MFMLLFVILSCGDVLFMRIFLLLAVSCAVCGLQRIGKIVKLGESFLIESNYWLLSFNRYL